MVSSDSSDSKFYSYECTGYDSYTDVDDDEEQVPDLDFALEKLNLGPKRDKLLVFSLNGLLIHRTQTRNKFTGQKLVYKRPFLDEFMKFCLDRFEVGLWSSAQEHNVDNVLNSAFGGVKKRLLFVWDQEQCTNSGYKTLENKAKPLFFKDLNKLWSSLANSSRGARFSKSNTLLIDDEPYKGLLNPAHTGIFPNSYDFKKYDDDNFLDPKNELGQYLEGLSKSEDVQSYVKDHPFGQPAIGPLHPNWNFYSRVYQRLKNKDFGA